jgi:signal peptidase I
MTKSRGSWLRDGLSLFTVLLATLAAKSSLAEHYVVPSGSMVPTIQIGDRVLVNKLAYGVAVPFSRWRIVDFAGPGRGDVAVLRSPEDGITLIKRVVAVPGDRVSVRAGRLRINDQLVPIIGNAKEAQEVLGRAKHTILLDGGGGPDFGPVLLGDDEYLVMGDNRSNSHDGRSFGLVGHRSFLGRASGIFWSQGRPAWHGL